MHALGYCCSGFKYQQGDTVALVRYHVAVLITSLWVSDSQVKYKSTAMYLAFRMPDWWLVISINDHQAELFGGLIDWPFKAQWSLYVPSCLTFSNSTFCPHSVFMCFVWIWEQTAIISLYSINWLVCITETECVYCAVRTGSLYTASLTFSISTFCLHSVFMCFVWIWEQTAAYFPKQH